MKKYLRNEFLLFLPYLLLFVIYITIKAKSELNLDEPTYLFYARNLLHGFYVPENTTFLWAGPGYPILLALFEKFNIPDIYQKLLNAAFLYGSLLCIYYALKMHIKQRNAILIAMMTGLYYPFYEMLPYRMTEVFVIFLISLILYVTNQWFKKPQNIGWMVLLFPLLGWLMVTKIIFGYVFVILLILFALLYSIKKHITYKLLMSLCFFSLLIISPYLLYTYQITEKFFYWGTSGGITLYWMSSPYPDEYGDFINFLIKPSKDESNNQLFKIRHEKDIKRAIVNITIFERLNYADLPSKLGILQDQQFKRMAIRNIRENPAKYVKNCLYNISRMLFNRPYSYRENPINMKYILCNILLIVLFGITLVNLYRNNIKVSHADFFLVIFAFIYLGCTSLLSANPRQFYIISPILFYFIGRYIFKGPSIIEKTKLKPFRYWLKQ